MWKITIPSKHINSKYEVFVGGKFPYEKLWDHLGKREKLDLRSTKQITTRKIHVANQGKKKASKIFNFKNNLLQIKKHHKMPNA